MANLFDDIIGDKAAAPAPEKNVFDPIVGKPGVVEDIAASAPSSAMKGVAGAAGIVGSLGDLWNKGGSRALAWGLTKLGYFTPEQAEAAVASTDKLSEGFSRNAKMKDAAGAATLPQKVVRGIDAALTPPSAEDLNQNFQSVAGNYTEPQTLPGQYVGTAIEFAPSILFGGGGLGSRAVQTLAAAGASETAGQAARKFAPSLEPAARAVGAVAGGVGSAMAFRPTSARQAVGESLQGAQPAQIDAAERLMTDAANMGVRLTWDEAIQQVTGGATSLGNLRRVTENSVGGGAVFKPLMAERPGQVQQAGSVIFGGMTPPGMNPVRAGTAARRAAEGELDDAQRAVNTATRPEYTAAQAQRVGPQVLAGLHGDPLFAQALREIRNDPALHRTIGNLPDDSVAVIDLVQRRLREMGENARVPGQATTSNLRAANYQDARTAPVEAAERATGGPYGDYARARQTQEKLRRDFLEPLTEGPLGTIAGTTDVRAQGRAILPNQPAAGSDPVVTETVSRLARRDPRAAQGVIANHLQSAFDEATQNLAIGPNQFGGAKYAAVIAGNGQQARNLEAAVTALPNGQQTWAGFRRFLDVLEATGQRPQPGSMTSFNTQLMKDMQQPGALGALAEGAKTGGVSLVKRLTDFRDRMNLGNNTAEVARILTDPRAARMLRQLADEPANSGRAAALVARLTYMAETAAQRGSEPVPPVSGNNR